MEKKEYYQTKKKKKDQALQMETCLNEVPTVNWNVSFNQGEIGEWG